MEMNYILGGFAEPLAKMCFCGGWMFLVVAPHKGNQQTAKLPKAHSSMKLRLIRASAWVRIYLARTEKIS